ncbi:MAG: hypothetical protein ACYC27_10700 [Armatimonadota bacterium]
MRKRKTGNTIFLEDDDGTVLLETEVNGKTATLRHGNWSMIKDMGTDAGDLLNSMKPAGIRQTCFDFYDVSIELRSNIPLITGDITGMYSHFINSLDSIPNMIIYALYGGGEGDHAYVMLMEPLPGTRLKGDFSAVSYFKSIDDLLIQIHLEIEVLFLTNNKNNAFIHGGAVEKDGVGYIFPAESGSGKTTLVLALSAAGYSFMSDEFAVLNGVSKKLFPFPRSLSIRKNTLKLFPEIQKNTGMFKEIHSPVETLFAVDPLQCFSTGIGEICDIKYVIFPRYDPTTEPSIKPISGMEAFRRLVSTKSYISLGVAEKQSAMDLILSVISKSRCFEMTTGNLDKTVSLIDSLGAG